MDLHIALRCGQNSRRERAVTLGCPILDNAFGGGISCRGVTEFVGESGSGKTQLALQLLLTAQLPIHVGGLAGGSMYLHTESPFPLRRLHQIAESMGGLPLNAMDRVLIQLVQHADHLVDLLLRLDVVVQRDNIKMLIIDSIASLFRGTYSNTKQEMEQRKNYLYKICAILNSLNERLGVAGVVTNQVTDVIAELDVLSTRTQPISVMTSGRQVRAALGRIWGTYVNARIFLTKEDVLVENAESMPCPGTRRRMLAVFSQYPPKGDVEFQIHGSGISGCRSQRTCCSIRENN